VRLAILPGLLFASASSEAQEQIEIPYRIACAACRIITEPLLKIGTEQDSILLDAGTSLHRDSKGRFFAIGFSRRSVVIFDSVGRFTRAFGRPGTGPGEIGTRISSIAIVSDSLFVFAGRRVSVYSPSLAFVRVANLPTLSDFTPAVVWASGNIVEVGDVPTPRSVGFPFHIVSPDGRIIRSFGAENQAVVPRNVAVSGVANGLGAFPFLLAPSQDHIWVSNPAAYAFTSWGLDGRWLSSIALTGAPFLTTAAPPPGRSAALAQPVPQIRIAPPNAQHTEGFSFDEYMREIPD
jgi:hypothetical protein